MTRPLANPTPLAQRGQGRKRTRSRLVLHTGQHVTYVTRSNLGWVTSTQDEALVMAPDGLALLRLIMPDGTQVELYQSET